MRPPVDSERRVDENWGGFPWTPAMTDTDPRIEAYFAKPGRWRNQLRALRAILRDGPLREEFKWRGPCYTCDGANLAMIFRLKDCCGLSFFKGVLLKDSMGILAPPGPNSRSARVVRFTDMAEIDALAPTLKAYVLEAVAAEQAGRTVAFPTDDLAPPAELTERLARDPSFSAAFAALTPGRRRGYLLHFAQPKQSATRAARIERAAPRILEGKGIHDR